MLEILGGQNFCLEGAAPFCPLLVAALHKPRVEPCCFGDHAPDRLPVV